MSLDLIMGKTRRSWSRDSLCGADREPCKIIPAKKQAPQDPSETESLKHVRGLLDARKNKNKQADDEEQKWFWNNYWDVSRRGGTSPGSIRYIFRHPRLHPIVANCQDSTHSNCEIKVLKDAAPVDWRTAQALQLNALKTKRMSKSDFNKVAMSSLDPEAGQSARTEAAEKMLKHLASMDVKVEGADNENQERQQLEELARRGDIKAILKLKKIRQEEAMNMHGDFAGSDEIEMAREGGPCERAALSRIRGIVISDREIKDAMQGSLALVGRDRRRRHHRHPG